MDKSCKNCISEPVCELHNVCKGKMSDERVAGVFCQLYTDQNYIPAKPLRKAEIIAAASPTGEPYCVCLPYDLDAPLDLNESHGPAHKCVPYSEILP